MAGFQGALVGGIETVARRVRRRNTVPRIELTPLRIAVIYLLFGTSFLVVSDVIFVAYLSDPLLSQVQALKGGLEVALTAGLIFLLARRSHRQLHRAHTQIRRKTKIINILTRVLRHNLRNSMTVIRGQIRTLDPQSPNTDDRTTLDSIIESTDDILELTEKTRQLEAVISADNEYQEFDITSLVQRAARHVETEYAPPAVTVEHPNAVVIDVMPSIETALLELIENAVKHTDETSTVAVSVERTRLHGTRGLDGVTITVADDGPGLPDSERTVLEHGSEDPLAHGSGLGLYMVHWIVTSHGGSITAATDEDGTTVECTLPARQRQTVTDEASPQPRLERVRDRFEAVFEESFDAMLIADDDGRYLNANEAAADLLGTSQDALLGGTITDFVPEEFDVETAWQEFQHSEEQRGTVPVVRGDGERRLVEYAATRDIVPGQHLSVLRDITERVERERRLAQAETIFEQAKDAIFLIDVTDGEFHVERVNDAYEELTGFSTADIAGETPREITGDEVGAEIERRYSECVQRRETIEYEEMIPIDGEQRYRETKLSPVIEDGAVVNLVGATRDVTDRKQREAQLRQERERFERLLETSPVGITILDTNGAIIRANDRAEDVLGLSKSEITTRQYDDPDWEIVDREGEPIPAEDLPFRRVVETGRPVYEYEHGIRLADGSLRWLSINARPLRTSEGEIEYVIAVITDRTAQGVHRPE